MKVKMRTRGLFVQVAAVLLALSDASAQGATAPGQTSWPSFMESLRPAATLSPLAAPLPTGLVSKPLAAGVSPDREKWLGKWIGWACRDFGCETNLFIEEVTPDGVTAWYAFSSAGTAKPVAVRVSGKFVGGELRAGLPSGAQLAYRLRGDGNLDFLYWRSESSWLAGLLRREDSSVAPVQVRAGALLKGRVVFILPDTGTELGDPFEIRIDEQDEAGRIKGAYSLYSKYSGRPEVRCWDAVRLPVTGRFDGRYLTLRLHQSVKSNLCEDVTWALAPGKEHAFEWKGTDGKSRVYLDVE